MDHVLVDGSQENNDAVGELVAGDKSYIYGITGGKTYMDSISKNNIYALDFVIQIGSALKPELGLQDVADVFGKIDQKIQNDTVTITPDTENGPISEGGLHLTNHGKDDNVVRYYAAFGGDPVVNANLQTDTSGGNGEPTFVSHTTGSRDNQILGGSVIVGAGGSAAIGVGNINVDVIGTVYTTGGSASADVEGNVTTTQAANANVIGWMNGGLALGIGSTDNNTKVSGNTVYTVDGTERDDHVGDYETPGDGDILPQITTALNVMDGSKINAIGVMGGGTAVTTLNGTANAEVGGTSTINVTNATVLGMIGGGAAASVDATGAAEALLDPGKQVGNDDGTSGFGINNVQKTDENGNLLFQTKGNNPTQYYKDKESGLFFDKDGNPYTGNAESDLEPVKGLGLVYGPDEESAPIKVSVNEKTANQGGIATSTTGDTYLNITGDSTVIAAIGGGMAAASHTYTYKGDGTYTDDPSAKTNDAWGSSKATATTGRSHITVNLPESAMADEQGNAWNEVSGAVGGFISGIKGNTTQANSLAALDGKGGVFGIFGGGVAVGHGSASSTLSGTDNGAHAIANTDGSDIKLQAGYAAAVFGGGAAVTINNARAEANMTDDVHITTDGGMKTVGLFGGGVAISMEGATASLTGAENNGVTGDIAKSTVGTVNIENSGDTKGLFGGGMAIGNSNRGGGKDAQSIVKESNITVKDGTVSQLDMGAFMSALRNDHPDSDEWPQWSVLGFNASGAMVDLKGIMDDTSIAAGGLGLGMTGKAEVTTANVTIAGENTIISKDILGGGIAVDNMNGTEGGAHVGTSNIYLNGGTVEGSVYAGGAVNGTTPNLVEGIKDENDVVHGYDASGTSSTVNTAIVNLNGTSVTGEISGQGYKVTTNYAEKAEGSEGENKFNPYENDHYNATYSDKEIYESVADGQSTLYISGTNTLTPLDTTKGKYTSDSKIHDFDTITVEADSVTKVEGLTANNTTALIKGGTVTTEAGAYLDISKLSADGPYLIADETQQGSTFWSDDVLLYDRMSGVYATTAIGTDDSSYTVNYEAVTEDNVDEATESFMKNLNAGPLYPTVRDAMLKGWDTSKGLTAGGVQYFRDWMSNAPAMDAAYGRGAMIGEDAAVTGNTVSIARDMADNVMQRLSFTDDYVQDAGWVNNDGGIWAKYIHRKYETEGMGSSFGGIHSSTDYDGAIVGVDFAKHGNFQSGVAFHYGSGDGNGLISRNDYDAWGFTLYGSLKDEEAGTNLMADVGYVTSDNDIDGTVNGKSLSADRDVDAWTIGLRGEKEYAFGQNQLVPYVGLRYMSVNPARYSVYYDGAKAFNADADNQNLWLLPIGVSFRNETVTNGGWRITPKLDLSYIWAFGDTDTDMTLDMGGVGSGLYYDVMDDNSWLASLGVEATKDVWSFGVGYGYQKGDDTKNKTWFVNASYAF